jgi:hypothetical protein
MADRLKKQRTDRSAALCALAAMTFAAVAANLMAAPVGAEEPVTAIQRDAAGNWDLEKVAAFKRELGPENPITVSVQLDLVSPEHGRTAEEAIRLCADARAVAHSLEAALGPHLLQYVPQKWPSMRLRTYVVTAAGIDSLLASGEVIGIMRWVEASGGFTDSYDHSRVATASATGPGDRAPESNPFRCHPQPG